MNVLYTSLEVCTILMNENFNRPIAQKYLNPENQYENLKSKIWFSTSCHGDHKPTVQIKTMFFCINVPLIVLQSSLVFHHNPQRCLEDLE